MNPVLLVSVMLICGLENERGVAVSLFVFLFYLVLLRVADACLTFSWATSLTSILVGPHLAWGLCLLMISHLGVSHDTKLGALCKKGDFNRITLGPGTLHQRI